MNSTKTTGFTPNTPKNLIIDAGALYKNYGTDSEELIGATAGGNTFTVKANTRQVKVDGVKGDCKGLEFIIDTKVTLATNLLEVSTDILTLLLHGNADKTSDGSYDIITGKTYLDDSDYLTNIALIGRISGSALPIIIILKNASNTDGLKWQTKDDADNVLACTFTAYIDPYAPDELPYEIRFPKSNTTNLFALTTTPTVSSNKVILTFSDTVSTPVPKDGFAVTVGDSADLITAASVGSVNTKTIELTLTTAPTAGQAVTVAYNKQASDVNNVKSANGIYLSNIPVTNVTNN